MGGRAAGRQGRGRQRRRSGIHAGMSDGAVRWDAVRRESVRRRTAKWYWRSPAAVVTFLVSMRMKSCVSHTHGQQQ